MAQHLLVPLTRFIGREAEIDDVRRLLVESRLVTLSGAGGVGKTRLAVHIADQIVTGYVGGMCHVDFAPIADADLVAVTVARALGLPDQPGRSVVDILLGFVGDLHMLLLLDNCEHLLDASAALVDVLLGSCPNLTVLATSREPIGVAGEVIWRVPSLSLLDEAVELFSDRARLVRPAFTLSETSRAAVAEICRRLDGVPLAIELAAAWVRAPSPTEILDSLHDRFRLLTGGARTALPRQQTLRASVDWSYSLLTSPERILFRRLAVFMGGFDLAAVRTVTSGGELSADQVLDLLTLLVDKSLVLVEDSGPGTRYRMLETMRQYAFEKLGESDEAQGVRSRHCDFYLRMASLLDTPARSGHEQSLAAAAMEIDNFRSAFAWSRGSHDAQAALMLASSLQPLWLGSGRAREGLAWLDAALTDADHDHPGAALPARAPALADRAVLHSWAVATDDTDQAKAALAIAREHGDQALLARALLARGAEAAYQGEPADHYLAEAAYLARAVSDRWRLIQVLGWQANLGFLVGDPIRIRAVAAEARDVSDAIGDRFTARHCRTWDAWAQMITGELSHAITQFGAVTESADAEHDLIWSVVSRHYAAQALVYQGDANAAQALLAAALPGVAEFGALWSGNSHGVRAVAALAVGDVADADQESRAAWDQLAPAPSHQQMYGYLLAEVALAHGDLEEARRCADEAVSRAAGWHRLLSLTTRSRVRMAEREPELADRDAHDALALAADLSANLGIPDVLECLAVTAAAVGSHHRAARLLGAAESIRRQIARVRFKVHEADWEVSVKALRNAMGDRDFSNGFAEGAAQTTLEAIAYARRGKGERRRPTIGWGSLTPAERDVVRLVCDGLANKDIAARLLVSPRTVQTHLTHVYTKLSLTSRVQLVQEASRREE